MPFEFEKTDSQEIRIVKKVFHDKQQREFLYSCPHCFRIRGFEEEASLVELGGEQYQDNLCDGWMQLSREALLVETVEELEEIENNETT